MTTGNISIPYGIHNYCDSFGCYPADDGYKIVRGWSGADRPKVPVVKSQFVEKQTKTIHYYRAGKRIVSQIYVNKIRKYSVRGDRSNINAPHPYSVTYFKGYTLPQWRVTPSGIYFNGSNSNNARYRYLSDPGWNSNDDLDLVSRLHTKIAGSDFNLGVFLGEGHEALAMIANAATRVDKAYRAYRRGDSIKAWNLLTDSHPYKKFRLNRSSNWLELQYGWLPLLQDAHSGAEFLAQQMLNSPPKTQFRVQKTINLVNVWDRSEGQYGFNFQRKYYRKSIIANVTQVDIPGLLGLKDPLSIAWELTPYSFVVDWFIPIGDYLAALSTARSISGQFITSFGWKEEGRDWYRMPAGDSSYIGTLNEIKGAFDRTISSSLNVPLPTVKPLSQAASFRHALNAVALLVGVENRLDRLVRD